VTYIQPCVNVTVRVYNGDDVPIEIFDQLGGFCTVTQDQLYVPKYVRIVMNLFIINPFIYITFPYTVAILEYLIL